MHPKTRNTLVLATLFAAAMAVHPMGALVTALILVTYVLFL